MSFDARDLRPGKDVFGSDGTYLGTVVWTLGGPPAGVRRAGLPDRTADQLPRGDSAGASHDRASAFSGEALGPMPTAALGNGGPGRQSMATTYATTPDETSPRRTAAPSELVVLRLLTSLDWSTLRPRIWRIPVSLVQCVSHERIVLSVTASDLEARRSP